MLLMKVGGEESDDVFDREEGWPTKENADALTLISSNVNRTRKSIGGFVLLLLDSIILLRRSDGSNSFNFLTSCCYFFGIQLHESTRVIKFQKLKI